jgi:RND family efflux transporter MFP subunit
MHSTFVKRFYGSALLSLTAILALVVNPAFAAHAQPGTVIASAVIVPGQITELGFLHSALIKEIPVTEGEQVQAGQTVAVLNTPDLEYTVTAAEAALRSALGEEKVQSYRRVKDRRNGKVFFDVVPPEIRQVAHARVEQTQAALEIAQLTLAQSTLVAPQDATVASIHVLPGEYVEQNQVVITLATLDALQLETTDLSERDITKVKVGAPVDIFIEALNENVTGKVIHISPKADMMGGDVVFKVTIVFDQQPEKVLWGMTAEVSIKE